MRSSGWNRLLCILVGPCALSALSALGGCSDAVVDTGVDPNRVLDEATPQELTAICDEISGELVNLWEAEWSSLTCTAFGVTFESPLLGTSCESLRTECRGSIGELEPADCSSFNTAAFDACDSTVGQLEACANAIRTRVVSLQSQLTCDTTREELASLDVGDVDPELCQQLAVECPAIAMFISVQPPSPE